MGVTLSATKKSAATTGGDPSGSPRKRHGRIALAIAGTAASVTLVAAMVLVGAQTRLSRPPTPSPLVAAGPIAAVVNGHVFMRSVSGWKDISPAQFGKSDPVAAQFLSANLGWTVDVDVTGISTKDVVIYRTGDGGATWKGVSLPWKDEGLANLVSMQFVDAQHGYFTVGMGEATSRRPGFFFATRDGGATWTKLAAPYGGAISFATATDGWLIGGGVNYARNLISVTHDGGHTWQDQPLVAPSGLELSDRHIGTPVFTSATNGVIAVNYGAEVVFYRSRDGGVTWLAGPTFPVSQAPLTNRESLPIISLFGDDGWAMVADVLYATYDGGVSWTPIHHSANLTAVQWLGITGHMTGWAVVARGGFCQAQLLTRCTNETLLTTSDGGVTWKSAA